MGGWGGAQRQGAVGLLGCAGLEKYTGVGRRIKKNGRVSGAVFTHAHARARTHTHTRMQHITHSCMLARTYNRE